MKYDLVSIGTVTLDLYYQGESLTHTNDRFELAVGGKYFADAFHVSIGGGGANVAIGARRQGLRAALLADVGENEFSEYIFSELKKEQVDTSLCQIEKGYRNVSCILLTERGEKTVINFRTPKASLMESKRDHTALQNTRAVFLNNLPNVSLVERTHMLRVAKAAGAITFVNFGVSDCRRNMSDMCEPIYSADYLLLNEFEYADMARIHVKKLDFSENLKKKIPQLASMETVLVVTCGSRGSYAYTNSEIIHQPVVKPKKWSI